MDLLKLLSTNEIVAQVVCFLILLTVLRATFWKKILASLDERKDRIASEFKRIEEMKNTADQLRTDYQHRIAHIEEEAKQKIAEAVAQSKKLGDAIREKAENDASRILENSKESIKA